MQLWKSRRTRWPQPLSSATCVATHGARTQVLWWQVSWRLVANFWGSARLDKTLLMVGMTLSKSCRNRGWRWWPESDESIKQRMEWVTTMNEKKIEVGIRFTKKIIIKKQLTNWLSMTKDCVSIDSNYHIKIWKNERHLKKPRSKLNLLTTHVLQ